MSGKNRVIIVVNKYWECDPVCEVLTEAYINERCKINLRPNGVTVSYCDSYPPYGAAKVTKATLTQPRIVYSTAKRNIEVWCISDLLYCSPPADQSSSEAKGKLLPIIFSYNNDPVELVVAVGTASSGPSLGINPTMLASCGNINGSVVVGSSVFMHNGNDDGSSLSNYNPEEHYDCAWGTIERAENTPLINYLSTVDFSQYSELFLVPPINASLLGTNVYINKDYVALGDVNVTDYTKYAQKDLDTGNEFFAKYPGNVFGMSMETTHSLIYQAAKDKLERNPPFIFISGVVDRFTHFNDDVNPKVYAQNFTGAHNAGVVVAYAISELMVW